MDFKEEIKKRVDEIKGIPTWLQYTVALATILGVFLTGWGMYLVSYPPRLVGESSDCPFNSTSTESISEILSKAKAYGTGVGRQDFLKAYTGSSVCGKGAARLVSRSGDGFLIDIDVKGQIFTCSQDGGEENERKMLLLEGETVDFIGTLTDSNVFGHGWLIGNCVLQKQS